MKKPHIPIKRDEKALDPVDPETIPSLLEKGDLLPGDLYFDDKSSSWKPLSKWGEAAPFGKKKFAAAESEDKPREGDEPAPIKPKPISRTAPDEAEKNEAEAAEKKEEGRRKFRGPLISEEKKEAIKEKLKARQSENPEAPSEKEPEKEKEAVKEEPKATEPKAEDKETKEESSPEKSEKSEELAPPASETAERSRKRPLPPFVKAIIRRPEFVWAGWIVALVFILIGVAFWVWAQDLSTGLDSSRATTEDLQTTVDTLKKELANIAEMAPPGKVRAVVTYEPKPALIVPMISLTVELFRREDVEAALARKDTWLPPGSTQEFGTTIRKFTGSLPAPIAVSLTDTNGRVELPIPRPGRYVILATGSRTIKSGYVKYMWLIGFDAINQPSFGISLNAQNAIAGNDQRFAIFNVNPLASPEKTAAAAH